MDSAEAMSGESRAQAPVSRRAVLRTAAHAAWAVPAIQVVAAAPAFAGSLDVLAVGASGIIDTKNRDYINVKVTITNTPGGALPGTGVLTFTYFSNAVTSASAQMSSPSGVWGTVGAAPTYSTAFAGIAEAGTAEITIRFPFGPSSKPKQGESVTVTATVTAQGFNGSPYTVSAIATATA